VSWRTTLSAQLRFLFEALARDGARRAAVGRDQAALGFEAHHSRCASR